MSAELTPYQASALQLLEQSKNARDHETTRAAQASFDRNEEFEARLQTGATYQGLLYEEALALGNLMVGISRKRRPVSEAGIELAVSEEPSEARFFFPELKYVNAKTPPLLKTAPEAIEGEDILHGYRFSTRARDRIDYSTGFFEVKSHLRRRAVIKRHVCDVVMDEVVVNAGTSEAISVDFTGFKLRKFDHETRPLIVLSMPEVDDPDSQAFLDQLALLRAARIELGDKAVTV